MLNANLRTQLSVRLAYEEMFLGGASMAVTLIQSELKTADDELHPKFIMLTFLLKTVNLGCEANKNYLLAGAHFLLHSMKYDTFPMQAGVAQDHAMQVTMRLCLKLCQRACASKMSEDMVLVTLAMSDMLANTFGLAQWTKVLAPEGAGDAVDTKRESMAFPHKPTAVVFEAPKGTLH